MRIAIIRQRYTVSGGAERYLTQLTTGLAGAGHEIHVFASRWTDPPPGVILNRVPILPGPAFLRVLSFAWAAHRMTRRGDFDLVHSFDRTIQPDIYRAGDGCHQAWLDRRRVVDGGMLRTLERAKPLHHTPDCAGAFRALCRLLRPGGTIAIWVYGKSRSTRRRMMDVYRRVTVHLPHRLLYALCFLSVPLYYLYEVPLLGNLLRVVVPMSRQRDARERVLETFDNYSPPVPVQAHLSRGRRLVRGGRPHRHPDLRPAGDRGGTAALEGQRMRLGCARAAEEMGSLLCKYRDAEQLDEASSANAKVLRSRL